MRYSGFQLYWIARAAAVMAIQITSVSVGCAIYEMTRSAFMLGLVGLVQFVPSLLLVLLTGQFADRYSRRNIMLACTLLEAICVGFILVEIEAGILSVVPIFVALAGFGIARAFFGPAVQSLMANVVPTAALPSAISWSTGAWQLATIACSRWPACFRPSSGTPDKPRQRRVRAGRMSWAVSSTCAASRSCSVRSRSISSLCSLVARQHFCLSWRSTFWKPGPWALGLLRSAAGIGGIAVALWLAYRPIRNRAGQILFASAFLFGFATAMFGLSQSIVISVIALVVVGASDMISVYIRSGIIQLMTPDEIRGRVNALNMVFVGAFNELGEFRAGSIASVTGAASAIVLGGVGSMVIAIIWFLRFVDLRKIKGLR